MRNSVNQAVEHYVKPKRPKVLLAEDDEDLRALICLALETDGYEVIEAADGVQLLELVHEQLLEEHDGLRPPALIISDILMPGQSGLQVLATIRAAEKSIPVVIITGLPDTQKHDQAKQLGAAAVFQKPFEVPDLRMAVLNLLPPLPMVDHGYPVGE